MVRSSLTENPTKKPTIFSSVQTTRHQSLKKFYDQLQKDSKFCKHLKIFFKSQPFTIKTKRKKNVTLFGSIHHIAIVR